ncbi:MAG: GGDEF domain-containing protein [Deinococcota bacterium]|jgi:diguanylate cyclase (GGDEF)-like protein|nr:GGDEF domain-containing protein [Deinococcota bacterium]
MTELKLLNRAEFDEHLAALPENQPLSLALIDLDHFQEVNESHGQAVGDEILRGVERILTRSLPAEAIVARIGGDEYAAALPDMPAESALILLEEVRGHFSSREASPSLPRKMTLSVGIAGRPPHAKTLEELFRAADEALYRAKSEGRGRTAIYVESKMTLKSNYYPKAGLERLAKLSNALNRTEASLLREALDSLLGKYSEEL